jgi:hypothetical protein
MSAAEREIGRARNARPTLAAPLETLAIKTSSRHPGMHCFRSIGTAGRAVAWA